MTCFFLQAEVGIRYWSVTGVQTCALPIFACQHPIEDSSEGILSQNADHNWRIWLGESVHRPLHQIREIVDKAGFDQVFRRNGGILGMGLKPQARQYHYCYRDQQS